MILLSVVCPAHTDRYPWPIIGQVAEQARRVNGNNQSPVVEFFCVADNGPLSTGQKRNLLCGMASGQYISTVDDDDQIAPDYINRIIGAIRKNPGVDLITFDTAYYVDGRYSGVTTLQMGCEERDERGTHYRLPTPICAIKSELCKEFEHPDDSETKDAVAMSRWLDKRTTTEVRLKGPVVYNHCWRKSNRVWRLQQSRLWGRP